MKKRIISAAVLLVFFFAVLFLLPQFILAIVVSAICAIAAFELIRAAKINNLSVLIYTIAAAVFVPMAVFLSTLLVFPVLTLITFLLSIFFILISLLIIEAILTFRNKKSEEKGKQLRFRQIPIALAAGILIPYMLSCVIGLRAMTNGHLIILLPIIAAVLTDTGAYFTGITLGKRKPFPNISPNKTVEGYVGGIIAGTIGMLIYGLILSYATDLTIIFPALILYGILGAVVTELGDLTFSFIKRKCDIKDYGKLFPGHGGVLDRFDSMTFVAPLMYLLVTLLPAILE